MSLPLLHAGRTNPGLSAALDLRFALDKSLTAYRGPTPSFSRASTGSYFDGSGVLRYAVLNYLQYSEEFNAAYWPKYQSSVTANAITAPDGKTTADKLVENSTNNVHGLNVTSFSTVIGQVYTLSVYAKAGERNWFSLNLSETGIADRNTWFNLANGTIGTNAAGNTPSITSVGNGWYRCSIARTMAVSNPWVFFELANADNSRSYLGDGTSGVYLWGAQLEASSTLGAYVQTTSSANSAPRFNHTFNGTSWVSRGLLVEEQRTNLLLQSSGFSTASWTQYRGTVTANAATSPDGTGNASNFTQSTGQTVLAFLQQYATTTATQFTLSVFAKANGKNFIVFTERLSSAGERYTFFNVSAGSIGTSNAAHTARIVNVGNGWYRCSVTFTALAKNDYFGFNIGDADNSFTCTDSGSVLFYGAMLEAGSFSTSHIETTSASTTRSADVCQITGTDFSGFWNGTEGSVAVEYDRIGFDIVKESEVFQATDSSGTNQFYLNASNYSSGNDYFLYYPGSVAANLTLGPIQSAGISVKASTAYKVNDFAGSRNGGAVVTDSSGAVPVVDRLSLGRDTAAGLFYLNGHIARLRYYRKRLPNETLQQLSDPDPTLNLQFALNKTLTPVAGPAPSFSRASTGSYFDSTGTLKYANVNLLTYSEQFDNAAWSERVGSTISTNVVASPIGDLTADQLQLTSSGLYYQKKAYTTTGTHTFSVWLRSSSPTTTLLRLSNDAGTENSVVTCNVTTSWQRFSVTRSWSANPVNFYAGLDQRTVVGGPGTSTDVFIWGAQLELASSPSQYAKTEASTTAGPRFDHTYSGGQWVSRGLLLEEQRTNLLLWSTDLSTWTDAGSAVRTLNIAVAPDGTTTAARIAKSATAAFCYIGKTLSPITNGATYTASIYAKYAGKPYLNIYGPDGSITVWFNIQNGTMGQTTGSTGYSITNVGNGWYRCSATFLTTSTTAYSYFGVSDANASTNCSQSGTDGIYLWGPQFELGAFPTSYIPTTTSSVTRSADVCQITGTSFGSMWNQGEGSFVAEYDRLFSASSISNASTVFQAFIDGSNNDRYALFHNSSGTVGERFNVTVGNVEYANLDSGVSVSQPVGRASSAYKLNDFALTVNGGSIVSDTSGLVVSNADKLNIGRMYSTNWLNGHIAKIIYYPARLTNTKLRVLSGSSISSFIPSDVAGLELWLDASDLSTLYQSSGGSLATADGDPVGEWRDKSGNLRHATQTDGTKKPALKLAIKNGLSALRMDGSNDSFDLGDNFKHQSITVIAVQKITTTGVCVAFSRGGAGSYNPAVALVYNRSTPNTSATFNPSGGSQVVNVAITQNQFSIFRAMADGSTFTNTTNGTTATTAQTSALQFNTNSVTIGCMETYGLNAAGDYCELIIYSKALSASEWSSVNSYLNAKWSIY